MEQLATCGCQWCISSYTRLARESLYDKHRMQGSISFAYLLTCGFQKAFHKPFPDPQTVLDLVKLGSPVFFVSLSLCLVLRSVPDQTALRVYIHSLHDLLLSLFPSLLSATPLGLVQATIKQGLLTTQPRAIAQGSQEPSGYKT
jgi:hypothetical protein